MNIGELPDLPLLKLLTRTKSYRDILNLCVTSKRINLLCKQESLWRKLSKRDYRVEFNEALKFKTIGFGGWKSFYELQYLKRHPIKNKDIRQRKILHPHDYLVQKSGEVSNVYLYDETYKGVPLDKLSFDLRKSLGICAKKVGIKEPRVWLGYIREIDTFVCYIFDRLHKIYERRKDLVAFFSVNKNVEKAYSVFTIEDFVDVYYKHPFFMIPIPIPIDERLAVSFASLYEKIKLYTYESRSPQSYLDHLVKTKKKILEEVTSPRFSKADIRKVKAIIETNFENLKKGFSYLKLPNDSPITLTWLQSQLGRNYIYTADHYAVYV